MHMHMLWKLVLLTVLFKCVKWQLYLTTCAGIKDHSKVQIWLILQDHISPLIPYGLISGAALLSGILCLTLKETGDRPTKEILDDKDWTESCLADTTQGEFSDEIRETDVQVVLINIYRIFEQVQLQNWLFRI